MAFLASKLVINRHAKSGESSIAHSRGIARFRRLIRIKSLLFSDVSVENSNTTAQF